MTDRVLHAAVRSSSAPRTNASLETIARAAGFLEWTRHGVVVSRRARGVAMDGLFAQVTNASRLALSPPMIPSSFTGEAGTISNSKSEYRAETRFLNRNRASGEKQKGAFPDLESLEEALARLGAALKVQEALT